MSLPSAMMPPAPTQSCPPQTAFWWMPPAAVSYTHLPPSTQELERRLRGRGTETEESIRERLEIARNELAQQDKFTLKLVNDEVDACAARLYDVICQRAGLTR